MSALALKKEAAAAIAQAEALEVAELDIGYSIKTDPSSQENLKNEIATRTNEYVEAQAGLDVSRTRVSIHATIPGVALSEASYITWHPPAEHNSGPQEELEEDETPYRPSRHDAAPRQPFYSNHAKSRHVIHISAPLNGGRTGQVRRDGQHTTNIGDSGHHTTPARDSRQPRKPKTTHHPRKSPLKATAPSYVPVNAPSTASVVPETEHLARYLARRDLVSTSLYQFDKPENDLAWQSSFSNATTGLGLTTEMLDLLIKWLGTESVKHIKRIRSVDFLLMAACTRLSILALHCFLRLTHFARVYQLWSLTTFCLKL